jgi:tRNA threonylcarbamoyladenosine dehydratase
VKPETDFNFRFSGIARLYSQQGLERLRNSHAAVIGVGGVGSWVAEALARSGVGTITLVDLDDVCVSNVNRQLHALDGEIGKPKVVSMASRIRAINPECILHEQHMFFNEQTAPELLSMGYDVVIDAIDVVIKKCQLIVECKMRGIPVVVMGSAGGRRDPTRVKKVDLARSFDDPLLKKVRKRLRQRHRFPRNPRKKWHISCVFSDEPMVYPQADGTVCKTLTPDTNLKLDCASGYGTASFVTGTFGFVAAAEAINILTADVV